MVNSKATWTISLDVECPHCTYYVDLLDDADFFEGKTWLEIGEHDTDHSSNLNVSCPECGEEFIVDLEY